MSNETIITLEQFCECYDIDPSIVRDFADFGLYPVVAFKGKFAIETRHLDRIERVLSLHRTLGINKEGIDIILELRAEITRLQQVAEESQKELSRLKDFMRLQDTSSSILIGRLIEIDD